MKVSIESTKNSKLFSDNCCCDYKIGDENLVILDNLTILDDSGKGLYIIIQLHAN